MNTESKFGLKDSVATAAILATMLAFILAGIITRVDARPARGVAASETAARAGTAAIEVQKMDPIIVNATRLSILRLPTIVVTAPRLAPAKDVVGVTASSNASL